MANYNVDIAVALKGAKELLKLKKDIKAVTQEVSGFNKALETNANKFPKTINSLTESVNKARAALKNAAVGTNTFNNAAEVFLRTQKALNKELAEEARILKQIETRRFGVAQSSSGNRVRRNVAESRRSRISSKFKTLDTPTPSIDLRNRVRENIRQSRISRFGSGFADFSQNPDSITSSLVPGQSLLGQSVGGASDRARQILREEQALQEALGRMNQRFAGAGNITPMELTGQSESIFRGQSSPVGARIKQTLENRKKSEQEIIDLRNRASKKIEANEKKLILLRKKALKQEFAERTRLLRQNQFANVNPGMGGFRAFSQRADQITAGTGGGRIGGNIPTFGGLTNRLNVRGQFGQGGAFAATGGQRARGALSNALIGGGFPLLFGQGALGAAGGGIGGALGGALGGGFGFGLSIAGTAIAQQIQQTLDFRKSIRELNKEMEQMGISSNISGTAVRNLGKSLGITKEEAVKALQEFKRFGDNAVLFAEKFGGDFAKFDAIAQANTVQSALAAIRKINKDLTLDDELRFINSVRRLGVEETINQMLDEMLEKEKKLKTAGFGQGEGKNAGANRKRLGQLRQESVATQVNIDKNKVFIEELTRVRDQFTQNRDAAEAANRGIRKGLEDVNAELRKLNDVQFQVVELSKTLGSAFSESFKGIIRGTMSVGDAFRNMFMRIADHFLDMAAQMMAAQISRGFLGLFGNAFGGIFGGGPANAAPFITDNVFSTGFDTSLIGAGALNFANGGRPPVGRASIVGERGPELFVPDRAGTIIPNHVMGGMNIVVNVDASGSNVEGDEDEGRALGIALSAAIETELIKQKRPGGLLA